MTTLPRHSIPAARLAAKRQAIDAAEWEVFEAHQFSDIGPDNNTVILSLPETVRALRGLGWPAAWAKLNDSGTAGLDLSDALTAEESLQVHDVIGSAQRAADKAEMDHLRSELGTARRDVVYLTECLEDIRKNARKIAGTCDANI